MRRLVILLALFAALALPGASAAAPAQDVTIAVRQYVSPMSGAYTLAFSGRIASGAAGESILLLVRECGYDHFRVVEGTTTSAGGFWSIETGRMLGSWRARWNDRWSNAVPVRAPIWVYAARVPGRRAWRVVIPRGAGAVRQDMHGRIVQLQRRTVAGRWVLVRQARLRATFTRFEAVFEVPTRGLTLRAVVPARSAAPCYTAGITQTWRS